MAVSDDLYDDWYAESLWQLLPAVYRAADSDDFDAKGPLRELVERIGVQMAVVRRSIDQIWEDQSIESCDDWVVPYIGDLLGANLLNRSDPRVQRLQVAKAIYYRRRAGTLAVLEEAARDVTGWEVRVVEFFRRIARARHGLDQEIGLPLSPPGMEELQNAAGLTGRYTRTPAGGFADLRNAYGATRAHGPFDEYFHTAEMRRGVDRTGWYNIPRLGFFVWRLHSFPEGGGDDLEGLLTTPVAGTALDSGSYTFDPTGRHVPLFAAGARAGAAIALEEWQAPGPIDRHLLAQDRAKTGLVPPGEPDLYVSLAGNATASLGVFCKTSSQADLLPYADVVIDPERGRFCLRVPPTGGTCTHVPAGVHELRAYSHHGFPGRIGADGYDRTLAEGEETAEAGHPVTGGGDRLAQALLPPIWPATTLTIDDSLTYTAIQDAGTPANPIQSLVLRSDSGKRPLIRPARPAGDDPLPEWRFHGGANATLLFEGIFLSGADVVLSGDFETVTLVFSTFDPGDPTGTSFALPVGRAIDRRLLWPSRLFVEGHVGTLRIISSITGPIAVRGTGSVDRVEIVESIVQAIAIAPATGITVDADPDVPLATSSFSDFPAFVRLLQARRDPVSRSLARTFSPETAQLLRDHAGGAPEAALEEAVLRELNGVMDVLWWYWPGLFPWATLSPETRALIPQVQTPMTGGLRARLNRRLLSEAYPAGTASKALHFTSGDVTVERSTIAGPAAVHRIDVSESILDSVVTADDTQHGCVRFSAWATGSLLPRKYESVEIAPRPEIFTSRVFGQPGYMQLRSDCDTTVRAAAGDNSPTLREGAENGSEMGAFYREMNAIRERTLFLKMRELMPIGLAPILIRVT
jgi:hypothetical protein